MIDAAQLQAWRAAAPGFLRRQAKHLQQARYGWDHRRQVSFVFGCQRSGTKMVMWVLEKSPATRIYHENHASAFSDFQLRPDPIIRALVQASPAPAQIFKPICDSHRAGELLNQHPGSRALWIVTPWIMQAPPVVVRGARRASVSKGCGAPWSEGRAAVAAKVRSDDIGADLTACASP